MSIFEWAFEKENRYPDSLHYIYPSSTRKMTKRRSQKEWFCYEKQYAHLETGSKAMRAEGKKMWNGAYWKRTKHNSSFDQKSLQLASLG